MAYVIKDVCICCGACAAECPVDAISEGDGIFVINSDVCIDCGACAGTCPVDSSYTSINQKSSRAFPVKAGFRTNPNDIYMKRKKRC